MTHEELQGEKGLDSLIEEVRAAMAIPGKTLGYSSPSRAAVSLILRPDPENADLFALLIKRRVRDRDPWSGHMALPGGRYADSDGDLAKTIIREVREETSIDLGSCAILGTLDEIAPGNFSIRVTPYVALAPEDASAKIALEEIESFFWVPLSFFRDGKNVRPYHVNRLGLEQDVPSYPYLGQHMIWGMTFRIIQDFVARISS